MMSCPHMARFGLGAFARQRSLVGVERTLIKAATTSEDDPLAACAARALICPTGRFAIRLSSPFCKDISVFYEMQIKLYDSPSRPTDVCWNCSLTTAKPLFASFAPAGYQTDLPVARACGRWRGHLAAARVPRRVACRSPFSVRAEE
jgi:hypothetical protein